MEARKIEKKKTLARQLHLIFTDEKFEGKREHLLEELELRKVLLLWEILFETDIKDRELLKEKIYHFGSMLKCEDNFGRELFVCLVTLLDLL